MRLDRNVYTPRTAKSVTMEKFWTWDKVYRCNAYGDPISGDERCTYFEKELWFELDWSMWRNHRSVFQDHVKYINNDIVKTFRVGIIQYTDHVCEMHDFDKYLPPPSMKGGKYDQADWIICQKYSLSTRFVLQLGTASQHPGRMQWMIKTRNIAPCTTNNGVASCPPWRQEITIIELRIK